MSDNEKTAEGRALFSPEEAELLEGLDATFTQEDPLADVDVNLNEPGGRKRPPPYKDSRYQAIALIVVVILGVWGFAANSFMRSSGSDPVKEDRQKSELKAKAKKYEGQAQRKSRENATLTQGAQFASVPMGQEKATPAPGSTKTPKSAYPKTPKPSRPRGGVAPKNTNTVALSRYQPKPPPPRTRFSVPPRRAVSPPSKPSGPSLSECAGYVETGLKVPACDRHNIQTQPEPTQAPIEVGQRPPARPPVRPPVKLTPYKPSETVAYAPKVSKVKTKPAYQVNYLAGEIQTVDQYEAEINDSANVSTTVPKVAMKAKVADLVEWDSAQVAQQIVIPLTITSGSHKGQPAEAKITKLNGVQFEAHLISLNDEPVEPGTMQLRRKNTRYLRAKVKRHGGSSFGNRIISAGLGVAGDVVSNRLANVDGGNHVSRLVPQGGQRGGQISQTWRFDGTVDIVPQ